MLEIEIKALHPEDTDTLWAATVSDQGLYHPHVEVMVLSYPLSAQ